MGIGVDVGIGVFVGLEVGVAVGIGVLVGVKVGVGVAVGVGVGAGTVMVLTVPELQLPQELIAFTHHQYVLPGCSVWVNVVPVTLLLQASPAFGDEQLPV